MPFDFVQNDARARLVAGVDRLTDCVEVTLGPKGRNVGLDQSYGAPKLTKVSNSTCGVDSFSLSPLFTVAQDGVTVAKAIDLSDKFENMGAQLIKHVVCLRCCLFYSFQCEALFCVRLFSCLPLFLFFLQASQTNDAAGDGTTTATVLARAIFKEGCKAVAAGVNPMDLRRGIQLAVDKVLEIIKSGAKQIESKEEIAQVSLSSFRFYSALSSPVLPLSHIPILFPF